MCSEWSSDWYANDFREDDDLYPACSHLHVTLETCGGRHFTEGEVWDDLQEYLQCVDCGETLEEKESLIAWHGGQTQIIESPGMVGSHGHD